MTSSLMALPVAYLLPQPSLQAIPTIFSSFFSPNNTWNHFLEHSGNGSPDGIFPQFIPTIFRLLKLMFQFFSPL